MDNEQVLSMVHDHASRITILENNFKGIDKKLDECLLEIKSLKPNREEWEWEKRVEDIEKKQTAFDKFKSRAIVAILLSLAASIGAVGPEVISLGIKTYIEEVKQSAQP